MDWNTVVDVPYSVNNGMPSQIYRVAYCLSLGANWVWTSWDYPGNGIGVPVDYVVDSTVSNMDIISNVGSINEVQGGALGNIEFWSHCYRRRQLYASSDNPNSVDCYGSMQAHYNHKTLWAFNGFSNAGYCDLQVGHGTTATPHTDGTFALNCESYHNNYHLLAFVK